MFIFRLFFSLIGSVIALILLPLRLIPLPVKAILLPFRMLLRMFARHTFAFFVVLVIGLIILHFSRGNSSMKQLQPAAAPQQTQNGMPAIIETVTKKEDGDSAFATDLYALMTEPERGQYSQQFYWAMSNLPNGGTHTWNSGNINGTLRANDLFSNNNGGSCRHFNEVLKVHAIQQTISGTACYQGNNAWCKLKPNATPSCGLSQPSGMFDGISNSLRNLF